MESDWAVALFRFEVGEDEVNEGEDEMEDEEDEGEDEEDEGDGEDEPFTAGEV